MRTTEQRWRLWPRIKNDSDGQSDGWRHVYWLCWGWHWPPSRKNRWWTLFAILLLLPFSAVADMSNWWAEVSVSGGVYRIEHPMSWANLSEVEHPDENPATGLKRIWLTEQSYRLALTGGLSQATISNLVAQTKERILNRESAVAALRALVKTINLRLPADKRITADELKAAIKEEL